MNLIYLFGFLLCVCVCVWGVVTGLHLKLKSFKIILVEQFTPKHGMFKKLNILHLSLFMIHCC